MQTTTSSFLATTNGPLGTSANCYDCGTPLPASTKGSPPLAWLGRHRRLVIGAFVIGVIAAALVWQWSWLVVLGVAPLLLSLAPCAAMCALGLCMHRMAGRSCGPANAAMIPAPADRGQIGSSANYPGKMEM